MMQPSVISGGGRKTELLGSEQAGDGDIASGANLPVGFEPHAAAEVVLDERLVGFGDAQFPGETGVLDRGEWRGSGPAAVAGDEDLVRMSFGHTGSDRAHANFRDKLDADPGRRGWSS